MQAGRGVNSKAQSRNGRHPAEKPTPIAVTALRTDGRKMGWEGKLGDRGRKVQKPSKYLFCTRSSVVEQGFRKARVASSNLAVVLQDSSQAGKR